MAELGKKRQGIIYKYTSPSGKCYIGQTINESSRKSKHKLETSKSKSKFGSAIRKYKWENFKYEILFKCNSDSVEKLKIILNTMEIYLINKYDSVNNGYNLALGGNGSLGCKHSDDWKEKASERMKGNQNSLGIKKTDEQKKEISEKLTGRILSDESKKKIGCKNSISILQFNKDDIFIAEFSSAVEAHKALNISRTGINNCCKGLSKSSGGFIWKYKLN